MPSYMNRAMQSRDPRFARVLEKLGHKRPEAKPAAKAKKATKLAAPREEPKPDDEQTVRFRALPGGLVKASSGDVVGLSDGYTAEASAAKTTGDAED